MEFTFMTANELKNVSKFSKDGYLTLADIDTFLNIILKNASARLSLDFDTLKSLVEEKSATFFKQKENYFRQNKRISSEDFVCWCDDLKIPIPLKNEKIANIRSNDMITENYSQKTTHKECIELFNSLSIEEKIKFIIAFEKIQISLTPSEISKLFK